MNAIRLRALASISIALMTETEEPTLRHHISISEDGEFAKIEIVEVVCEVAA